LSSALNDEEEEGYSLLASNANDKKKYSVDGNDSNGSNLELKLLFCKTLLLTFRKVIVMFTE